MSTTNTHHRATTRRAALAAAAIVLLTAAATGCSSASKPSASGDITGAGSGAPTATSPSPSASATAPAGAPAITLPADVTVSVEWKATGDATKDAVQDATAYALRAFNEAQATGNAQSPAMTYAFSGVAGGYMADIVKQLSSKNQTITGTDRFYAATVAVNAPTKTVINYCEDQSKTFAKDKGTGKVLTSTPSLSDFWAWKMDVEKSDQGVWKVVSADATKGDQRCQSAS